MNDKRRIELIRNHITMIEHKQKFPQWGTLFFTHLFNLQPALADVLNGDTAMLQQKFFNTIATLKNAYDMEKFRPSLEAMAGRHAHYGVELSHFPPFRQALLDSLQEMLGEDLSDEGRQAWESTLDAIIGIMQEVIRQTSPEAGKKIIRLTQQTHLLDDIGGVDKVRAVHQRFYDYMYDDAYLIGFFHHRSKQHLIDKQTEFMVAAFGGENHYRGQPPAFIHMHMLITREMSDIRTIYLKKAIREEGLSDDIARRWLAIDATFHPSIIKESIDECIMLVKFQHPLTVKKPEGYIAPTDDT